MKHFDENTLELYVLGAPMVEDVRSEIEAHMRECAGCRALIEEMGSFYGEVNDHLREQEGQENRYAVVWSRREIMPRHEVESLPVIRHGARLERVKEFVLENPMKTGAGLVAAAAAAVIFLNLSKTDDNPAYIHINSGQSKFEVYNDQNEMIWQVPASGISGSKSDLSQRARVFDMDGDGNNEIITSISVGPFVEEKQKYLRVFGRDRRLLRQVGFEESIRFRGRGYEAGFRPRDIIVEDFIGEGTREIFTQIDMGRSPNAVVRLDVNGNIIGQYWHFGVIYGMDTAMIGETAKKVLVLGGVNDLEDEKGASYPVIIVLDPTKLKRKIESVGTPGFGFSLSQAELYYIRLPESDLSEALNAKCRVLSMVHTQYNHEDGLSFWVRGDSEGEIPIFQYFFSKRDMSVLGVKGEDHTSRVYADLVQQGRLSGTIDQQYLDGLKEGVRYWDGRDWQRQPVQVKAMIVN